MRQLSQFFGHLPFARYLTLYLIFGMLVGIFSLWLFASIAEDVVEGDSIVAFDVALADALHLQAKPLSSSLYRLVSWFGGQGIWVIGLLVGVFLVLRRRWLYLSFWVIALAGGGLLNGALKTFFARSRPRFIDPLVVETFYSFPSAHAMTSLITYGMMAYLLCQDIKNHIARILIVFVAALLIVMIGISRLMLGVHYFSDVVAGFAAGGIWLSVCITAMEVSKRRGQTKPN